MNTGIEEKLNSEEIQKRLIEKEKGLYANEDPPKPNIIMGYTPINKDTLPSNGMFYQDSLEIHIKSASVKEIRFFTSLNEDSSIDVKQKINFIISKCCKFINPKGQFTYMDVCDIDKMYLLFAIRDLTFSNIPNSFTNESYCTSCSKPISIDIMSSNTTFYKNNEFIYKHYNPAKKCFDFVLDNGEDITLKLPTIGAIEKITEYITNKQSLGSTDINYDTLQDLLYLNIDWRYYTIDNIHQILTESIGWSLERLSLIVKFKEVIDKSIIFESHSVCKSCSAEVAIPFSFQGRLGHIFIIQNIFDRLR